MNTMSIQRDSSFVADLHCDVFENLGKCLTRQLAPPVGVAALRFTVVVQGFAATFVERRSHATLNAQKYLSLV